ncbi:hypothetical protein V9K67_19495 [Paraflavisolibacter sp. H34]|uniref:hypothetical protein n=1 Tax=Huijunlia imazamoxiresistens TaxID=3127457 RepID=UPI003016BA50
MNNAIPLSAEFERKKNVKASAITAGVAALILLLAIIIKWPLPVTETPVQEEFMEVNLGSGDQGFGTDQPLLPGTPAPAEQTTYTPPQPVRAVTSEAKDVETDDREENDAPAITKPTVATPKATRINEQNKTVKTATNPTPEPVAKPTPAPPRPKAVLGRTTGGTGNGGNGADSYHPGGSEGIAGGTGDQGRPGGDPNGKSYTGTPKNFGVQVFSIPNQSFEDDFNENAKVALDITVDENGKVKTATLQPRGTTTSNRNIINIARRRAFELKFSSSQGGQKGTVVFNFSVKS